MEKENEDITQERAPFNMALSTLKKIQDLLVLITKATLFGNQEDKYRIVLQFHLQAVPLILDKKRKEQMQKIKKELREIKILRVKVMNYGIYVKTEIHFSPQIDFALDDIVEKIQLLLQAEGYFMPPSEDEDLY